MPIFSVSISDTDGNETASGQAQVASVVDYSNYDTSDEAGHLQAAFADYKKVILTSTYGGYSYTLSAQAGEDALINTPAVEVSFPITHTAPYEVDDVHNIVLIAVPTWDSGVAYLVNSGHHVYRSGSLYQCIQDGTNQDPVTETAYWTEVTDDDLPLKYRLSHSFKIVYDITQAYVEQVQLANDVTKALYRKDLVSDPDFQAASKLWTMLEGMDADGNLSLWGRVNDTIVKAKELINEL